MEKKKRNIWLYFIGMVFLFMIIDFINNIGVSILYNSFMGLKYGKEIITEAIFAGLILIILLLFKNSYIFKQKSEKLGKGFKLGLPIIFIGLVILILNITTIYKEINIPVILNLATFCFLIGIAEEFLCRGWLLNEFLERFKDSKKNIILSIVLSSLVFGAMHITNIFVGQTLIDTLVQILNATFIGIIFACIYYKTKNIWSVVLIHAFWDFSIMIGETVYLGDCVSGNPTSAIILYNTIDSIVIIVAMAIICYWLFRQIKFTDNEEIKPLPKVLYFGLPLIAAVLYLGSGLYTPEGYEDYYVCTTYEKKSLGDNFETQYYYHNEYNMSHIVENTVINDTNEIDENGNPMEPTYTTTKTEYNFKLQLDKDNNLEFINTKTNDKVILTDGLVADYLLYETNDYYFILIENVDFVSVLYAKFNKNEITNDKEYLNKVKDSLKEYNTPNIGEIGTTKVNDKVYAHIKTDINDILYFGEDGQLYLNAE